MQTTSQAIKILLTCSVIGVVLNFEFGQAQEAKLTQPSKFKMTTPIPRVLPSQTRLKRGMGRSTFPMVSPMKPPPKSSTTTSTFTCSASLSAWPAFGKSGEQSQQYPHIRSGEYYRADLGKPGRFSYHRTDANDNTPYTWFWWTSATVRS